MPSKGKVRLRGLHLCMPARLGPVAGIEALRAVCIAAKVCARECQALVAIVVRMFAYSNTFVRSHTHIYMYACVFKFFPSLHIQMFIIFSMEQEIISRKAPAGVPLSPHGAMIVSYDKVLLEIVVISRNQRR